MWTTIFWPVCSDLHYVSKVICQKPNWWTWYRNLPLLEPYFEQNCSCQKFCQKPNRGNWYKSWSFSKHYFEQLELFDWKTIFIIKKYEPFWTFSCITYFHTSDLKKILKIVQKRLQKQHTCYFSQRSVSGNDHNTTKHGKRL
jgi:hypothetical protein